MIGFNIGSPFVTFVSVVPLKKKGPQFFRPFSFVTLRQKINPLEILVTLVTFWWLRMIGFNIGSPFVTFVSVVPLKKKGPQFFRPFSFVTLRQKINPLEILVTLVTFWWLRMIGFNIGSPFVTFVSVVPLKKRSPIF